MAAGELNRRRGQDEDPDADALAWGRAAADRVARRFGVRTVDAGTLARWQDERDRRTLYLLDVRQPAEFESGHLPGSRNAQGGQLVQATDRFVGTQNARIVLIDDTGTRATMTASWLIQMGWKEVAVLEGGLGQGPLETGPVRPAVPELDGLRVGTVDPARLSAMADAVTVDLGPSIAHRAGHVPGAWWAIRARLADEVAGLPAGGPVVLTSPDGQLARLAAADLAPVAGRVVLALEGGTAAWTGAGMPLEQGIGRPLSAVEDVYYRPYDRTDGVEEAMNAYLTWEVDLLRQLERDGTLAFPGFPA